MNINILRYSLFGVAGGQEVGLTFVIFSCFFFYRKKSLNSCFYQNEICSNGTLTKPRVFNLFLVYHPLLTAE